MHSSSQAQNWLDTDLYPFESNYVQLPAGRMHYVDEGSGEVILFVHGTPTWSFLFRDFVKKLARNHRCIAVDHLGFGLSDRPEDSESTPQAHAKNLATFINQLGLKDITLVVHDFGGPVGLGWAVENPDRVKRIVLFNTWLWETKHEPAVQQVNRIVNSYLGRFLYLRMNFSPKVLLKKGFSDKKKLAKHVHQHYVRPFPDKRSRRSLLKLAQSLLGSSDWYRQRGEQLGALRNKPQLILWGTKDTFITLKYLERWKKQWPRAVIREFDCGHFVPEESTQEAIESIACFMGETEPVGKDQRVPDEVLTT